MGEKKIEAALLDNLDAMVTGYIKTSKIEDARVRDSHATDKITDIKAEMTRLTKAYRKGRISEAEYDREYDDLEVQLQELQSHLEPILERDLSQYEELLKSDWKELYNALNSENKRAFWRNLIKEIHIDSDYNIKIIFY